MRCGPGSKYTRSLRAADAAGGRPDAPQGGFADEERISRTGLPSFFEPPGVPRPVFDKVEHPNASEEGAARAPSGSATGPRPPRSVEKGAAPSG